MLTHYKIITNNVAIGDHITPHHIYLSISKFPEIVLTYSWLFLHNHIYKKRRLTTFLLPFLLLNNIIMLFLPFPPATLLLQPTDLMAVAERIVWRIKILDWWLST